MTQAVATAQVERPRALAVWTEPNNIALLTIAGILLHLFLRYLLITPRIAWQVPLIVVLIVGGVPLLVPLTQKLFAREFGSDHLAGISIIIICMEYKRYHTENGFSSRIDFLEQFGIDLLVQVCGKILAIDPQAARLRLEHLPRVLVGNARGDLQ